MQEAIDSSAIENIITTHDELFRVRDIGSKKINHPAKEVENCRGNYWGRIPFYIPSIDHLFDRGYISFEDTGRLLISPVAHKESLHRMECPVGDVPQIPVADSKEFDPAKPLRFLDLSSVNRGLSVYCMDSQLYARRPYDPAGK